MSTVNKSAWEKVVGQFTDPWDWAFGIAGAGVGAAVTLASHGADLGTSVTSGLTLGVAARKALVASFQRKKLKRQTSALRNRLLARVGSSPSLKKLIDELDLEIGMWEDRTTSNEELTKQMGKIIDKFRASVKSTQQVLPPPVVSTPSAADS